MKQKARAMTAYPEHDLTKDTFIGLKTKQTQ